MIPKEILKKVRQIEIRTGRMVNDILAGEYHSVFKGQGMEFSEVREYAEGDDIRTIDWNVTARTGSLHVKRFVEERELTVMLVVDASASGKFGTSGHLKIELGAELSALLAFAAIKNNDRVGLIVFTDRIEKYIPPKKGRKHVLRLVREVLAFEPQGRGTNVREALDYLNRVQKRKSIVFLISDLIDQDWERSLKVTNEKHDVVMLRLQDARERDLPSIGLVYFEDAETGEEIVIDTSDRDYCRQLTESVDKQNAQLRQSLNRLNIDYIDVTTGEDYLIPLVRLFERRARSY
jgi:uncharacterized protein (DUF58 family)